MSLNFGDSSTSGQQAQQAATVASTSGAKQGTYQSAPTNAAQLQGALGAAQNMFQTGTPTTQAGLNSINTGAQGGTDLYMGAQPVMANTLAGNYTSAQNPFFANMVQQSANQIRPNVDSGFEASGRGGSGANANALDSAVANMAGNLGYQNYSAERGIQNQALQNLPSYTAGMFQPGQAQLTAGYTPLNQFFNQLKTISPGMTGSFDTTESGTSNTNANTNTQTSGNQFGANAGTVSQKNK
jgi:hypothetical protein